MNEAQASGMRVGVGAADPNQPESTYFTAFAGAATPEHLPPSPMSPASSVASVIAHGVAFNRGGAFQVVFVHAAVVDGPNRVERRASRAGPSSDPDLADLPSALGAAR